MKFTFRKDKYNQYHLYIDNKKIYKWYLYELKSFNNVLYPTHILFLGTKFYQFSYRKTLLEAKKILVNMYVEKHLQNYKYE